MAQITTSDGSGSASAVLQGRAVEGADWSEIYNWVWSPDTAAPPVDAGPATVTEVGTSAAGTTVQLYANLPDVAANVYAMAGTSDQAMEFPAAFQVAAPFGADVGGVPPAFFAAMATAEFDSWLTVGVTDGSAGTAIAASPGRRLDTWTDEEAFTTSNGAVFWMNPADGPGGSVVMAQVTTSDGSGSASAVLQGKMADGTPDWSDVYTWSW
jgi:hypothetical protein